MNLAMAEGFLMAPPADNILDQTVGLIEQATVPLRYVVNDPTLPYGVGAPAIDGYQVLMRAGQTLRDALHGGLSLEDARSSASEDVRSGRLLLKTAIANA